MLRTFLLIAMASSTAAFSTSPALGLRTPYAGVAVAATPRHQPHKLLQMSADSKPRIQQSFVVLAAVASLLVSPMPSYSVSGGIADFVDVVGQDFSGQDLKKKDFSGAKAKGAKLVKAKLQGARFFKSDLQDADFTGADLTTASLEDAKLSGVVLKDAVLRNAYTGLGLDKVKDITNADFTDALVRPDIQAKLCDRPDATGTNPKTGADTRESLQCP